MSGNIFCHSLFSNFLTFWDRSKAHSYIHVELTFSLSIMENNTPTSLEHTAFFTNCRPKCQTVINSSFRGNSKWSLFLLLQLHKCAIGKAVHPTTQQQLSKRKHKPIITKTLLACYSNAPSSNQNLHITHTKKF